MYCSRLGKMCGRKLVYNIMPVLFLKDTGKPLFAVKIQFMWEQNNVRINR